MIFFIILCTPGIAVIGITSLIPNKLMKLYTCWYIILALLFYVWTIQQPSFVNERFGNMHGDIFWMNIAVSATPIIIRLIYIFVFCLFDKDKQLQFYENNHSRNILKQAYYLTAVVYGWLASYFLYLFHDNLFVGYRPAYLAYANVFIIILGIFILASLLYCVRWRAKFKTLARSSSIFLASLGGVIYASLILSITTPIVVSRATQSIIKDNHLRNGQKLASKIKYCIQAIDSTKRTSLITTRLDLSSLIMRSKAPLGNNYWWGNLYYQALLIVEKEGFIYLYSWSYKQKKWLILSPDFAKKAMIDQPKIVCIPQQNYLSTIPLIFPKKMK